MNNNLLEVVSKVRYELLLLSGQVSYTSHLFRYFNILYHEGSNSRQAQNNPAAGLKSRDQLQSNAVLAVNQLFEKVYTMLRDNVPIEKNASADLMLLYSIGFNVRYELAELNENNKHVFFNGMIAQYNKEFHANFSSMEAIALKHDAEDSGG